MSWPDCEQVLASAEILLDTDDAMAAHARQLLASGASAQDFIEAFASRAEPAMRDYIRQELAVLPSSVIPMIVRAWMFAHSAGKPFALRGGTPGSPLEFARRRRVELSFEIEEDGVTVRLSHVRGRHASWYAPAVA